MMRKRLYKSRLAESVRGWFQRSVESFDHQIERRWFNLGLTAKMAVQVAVGLTGLILTFSLLGISASRQAAGQVVEERILLARLSANSLNSSLHNAQNMLSLLAQQHEFTDPQLGMQKEKVDTLSLLTVPNHGIYLVDTTGAVQASSPGSLTRTDLGNIDIVQSALYNYKPGYTALQELAPSGHGALIAVSVPVPSEHNPGEVVGALVAMFDLGDPNFVPLEGNFDLKRSATLEIVDKDGSVLFSTLLDRVFVQSVQDPVLQRLFSMGQPGVETCIGCSDGEVEQYDEVVAYVPLESSSWGVLVRQQAQEVLSPVRRLTTMTLILGLVSVFGALGLVWVTTNSVIRPVSRLTEAVQRMAQGDLTTPLDLPENDRTWWGWLFGRSRRGDEIGGLAASFQKMRRQLKQSIDEIYALNQDLDARVQIRTADAIRAQKEAQAARDDLRAVIDALNDQLLVIGVDDRRIQQANAAAVKSWADRNGNNRQILNDTFCYEALHDEEGCTPPNCQCPVSEVLRSGKSVKVTHVHTCEQKRESCYYDVVASPMRDAEGNITRIVELIRDVTHETQMRESLLRRNQEMAIINSVALTANQSLHLDDMLEKVLKEVMRLTEIDAGAVFLREEALGQLELVACRGLSSNAARLASQIGLLDSSCGGVVDRAQIAIVPELHRYRGRGARSLQKEQLCTLVHVPLIARGLVLGSMCIGTKEDRHFTEDEQELLMTLGSQIAAAVENARLYAEVQHKEKLRGELFKKALNAQEEERRRIARELHDDTSQSLAAVLFAAEECLEMDNTVDMHPRLEKMRELAQHTLDGVHKIIFDLRPTVLDHLGLTPALRWFADFRLESNGVRVSIEEVSSPARLPTEIETALFRVVQEAINNIARHSAARNVRIMFQFDAESAEVLVEDDGVGFDVTQLHITPGSTRGLGLVGMQERLELLGGSLTVCSEPGFGTQLRVFVPLGLEEDNSDE